MIIGIRDTSFTLGGEQAESPQEALEAALAKAEEIRPGAKLREATIRRAWTLDDRNWEIEATFEDPEPVSSEDAEWLRNIDDQP